MTSLWAKLGQSALQNCDLDYHPTHYVLYPLASGAFNDILLSVIYPFYVNILREPPATLSLPFGACFEGRHIRCPGELLFAKVRTRYVETAGGRSSCHVYRRLRITLQSHMPGQGHSYLDYKNRISRPHQRDGKKNLQTTR